MQIPVEDAREYFAKPKQWGPVDPEHLPGWPFLYFARDGLCICAHETYHDVWMIHIAADPKCWGNLDAPGNALLAEIWEAVGASLIIAWIPKTSRAVLRFAERCDFFDMGQMPTKNTTFIMKGWKPCQYL